MISCTPVAGVDPTITPTSSTLSFNQTVTFAGGAGTAPYRYSIVSGKGCVDSSSGAFRAVGSGVSTVKVTDANCRSAQATVTVNPPVGSSTPNDPRYSAISQWGFAMISAPSGWGINTNCSSIKVAVIDTGIDYNHPDLAGNMDAARGWNFSVASGSANQNDPMDDNLHGTHVAGIIGAVSNNAVGVASHCWQAKLLALKFLDSTGSGYTSDAVSAIDWGISHGAKIMNNSWGGGGYSSSLFDAIERANAAGILFVAAAGNDGINIDNSPQYPASMPHQNVLAVASSNSSDNLSSFSNYGVNSVLLAAPGSGIQSTFPTTMTSAMTSAGYSVDYGTISGTSMATPQVSGAAALLWSYDSHLNIADIKARFLSGVSTGAAFTGKTISGGRLNSLKVMDPGQ